MPDRVLVVDDDQNIRDLVHAALTSEGFIVSMASSAAAALRVIDAVRPDLVILDIVMETRDAGHRLCRQVIAEHEIPVIFLTSQAADVDEIVGLELGADDYMTKPFNDRLLVARVRSVLRRTVRHTSDQSGEWTQWELGPYRIDEVRSTVETAHGERELSRTEFLVLHTLASDVGRVFRREEIIEKVYGPDEAASPRTIDSHIRRLRAKLAEIGDDPIETVRGVGYRLRFRKL